MKKKESASRAIDERLEELEEWVKRFGETVLEKPSWNLKNRSMEPLRDIRITPTEVLVTVDLPLSVESSVRVKPLDEDTLEISAEMKRTVRFKEMGITHYEGNFQRFHCHSRVPVPVQMEKMKIKFKKGRLEIHLPRKCKE